MFGELNVAQIKMDINLLAGYIRSGVVEKPPEHIKKKYLSSYFGGGECWLFGAMARDYTKLCALRATMRGRVHFSPNTDVIAARTLLGIKVKAKLVDGVWQTEPIDLETQTEWVADLADQYEVAQAA